MFTVDSRVPVFTLTAVRVALIAIGGIRLPCDAYRATGGRSAGQPVTDQILPHPSQQLQFIDCN
ncbi:hypothetical protein [Streptomyces noursei]|uniref:hypothetical protein n=1 Tax=Streptomyces noursei TaxID=1971 RepID=UPI0030B7FB37